MTFGVLLCAFILIIVGTLLEQRQDKVLVMKEKQDSALVLAAKQYFQDRKISLPQHEGDTEKVLLITLIRQKYFNPQRDKLHKDCDFEKSYIAVKNQGRNQYLYYINFLCPNGTEETLYAQEDSKMDRDLKTDKEQEGGSKDSILAVEDGGNPSSKNHKGPMITVGDYLVAEYQRDFSLLSHANVMDRGLGVKSFIAYIEGREIDNTSSLAIGWYDVVYVAKDRLNNETKVQTKLQIVPTTVNFAYQEYEQQYVIPMDGIYEVTLSGAQGSGNGGKGATLSGRIYLRSGTVLNITTGGSNGFHGGGKGASGTYSGGGSSSLSIDGTLVLTAAGGGGGAGGGAGGTGTGVGGKKAANASSCSIGVDGTFGGGGSSSKSCSYSSTCQRNCRSVCTVKYGFTSFYTNKSGCSSNGYSGGGECHSCSNKAQCGGKNYICYCCQGTDPLGNPTRWDGQGYCIGYSSQGSNCTTQCETYSCSSSAAGKAGQGGQNEIRNDLFASSVSVFNGERSGNGQFKLQYIQE